MPMVLICIHVLDMHGHGDGIMDSEGQARAVCLAGMITDDRDVAAIQESNGKLQTRRC